MNRCPICRGRINAAISCPRCDADLHHLMQIEHHSARYCQLAIQFLQSKNADQAFACANKADALMRTPFTEALCRFVWEIQNTSSQQP